MPINYDEMQQTEDRAFIIRGETFQIPHIHPNVMTRLQEIEAKLDSVETHEQVLAIVEERLVLLLDDSNGSVERWQKLRADEANPVSYGEIMDISRRAVEMITGLPTMQPAPSVAGRGKTASSSKGE